MIAKRARENQVAGLKQGTAPVPQNSAKRAPLETRAEIAKIAGVSHDTVAKVKKIERAYNLCPARVVIRHS